VAQRAEGKFVSHLLLFWAPGVTLAIVSTCLCFPGRLQGLELSKVRCGSGYDEVFFTDEAKVIAVACSRSP
jgi:hypothetical protein